MSELKDAVNKVQSIGGLFKAVIAICDAVDDVSKIDQLASEANARLSAAKSTDDALVKQFRKEWAAREAQLETIKADILTGQRLAAAEKNAAKIVIADAHAEQDRLISHAKSKAADIVAAAAASKLAAESETETLKRELSTVKAQLFEKNQELFDVQAKIDAARETVKKMMGG